MVDFLGKIGKDDHQGNTAKKILELLWNLAHTPQLSTAMIELALDAHSSILIESTSARESEKKAYIAKCVDDIKKVSACMHVCVCVHVRTSTYLCVVHAHKYVSGSISRRKILKL